MLATTSSQSLNPEKPSARQQQSRTAAILANRKIKYFVHPACNCDHRIRKLKAAFSNQTASITAKPLLITDKTNFARPPVTPGGQLCFQDFSKFIFLVNFQRGLQNFAFEFLLLQSIKYFVRGCLAYEDKKGRSSLCKVFRQFCLFFLVGPS